MSHLNRDAAAHRKVGVGPTEGGSWHLMVKTELRQLNVKGAVSWGGKGYLLANSWWFQNIPNTGTHYYPRPKHSDAFTHKDDLTNTNTF